MRDLHAPLPPRPARVSSPGATPPFPAASGSPSSVFPAAGTADLLCAPLAPGAIEARKGGCAASTWVLAVSYLHRGCFSAPSGIFPCYFQRNATHPFKTGSLVLLKHVYFKSTSLCITHGKAGPLATNRRKLRDKDNGNKTTVSPASRHAARQRLPDGGPWPPG